MESEKASDDSGGKDPAAGLNIYQRLREIRREVHGVDKNGKHNTGFRFVSHDDVTRALGGLYVKWGVDREVNVLEAKRENNIIGMMVRVTWVNVDDPRDRKAVSVFAEGVDIIKHNGQLNVDGLASGKGLSYAVKMAELKNFCLVGDTTADNERAPYQPAPDAKPLDSSAYEVLLADYANCKTMDKLTELRAQLSPMVAAGSLTQEQMAKLSAADSAARDRSKGK